MYVLSCFSRVQLFVTLWAVACQAPLSMGVLQARILEWVAISSSRGSSHSGIEPVSPVSPALAGRLFTTEPLGKPPKASFSVQFQLSRVRLFATP